MGAGPDCAAPSAPALPRCENRDCNNEAVHRCVACGDDDEGYVYLCDEPACFDITHYKTREKKHRSSLVKWDADTDPTLTTCATCAAHGEMLVLQCAEDGCNNDLLCSRCFEDGPHKAHTVLYPHRVAAQATEEAVQQQAHIEKDTKAAAGHRVMVQRRMQQYDEVPEVLGGDFAKIHSLLDKKEKIVLAEAKVESGKRRAQGVVEEEKLNHFLSQARKAQQQVQSVFDTREPHEVVRRAAGVEKLERPLPTITPLVVPMSKVMLAIEKALDGIQLVEGCRVDSDGECLAGYLKCSGCQEAFCTLCAKDCGKGEKRACPQCEKCQCGHFHLDTTTPRTYMTIEGSTASYVANRNTWETVCAKEAVTFMHNKWKIVVQNVGDAVGGLILGLLPEGGMNEVRGIYLGGNNVGWGINIAGHVHGEWATEGNQTLPVLSGTVFELSFDLPTETLTITTGGHTFKRQIIGCKGRKVYPAVSIYNTKSVRFD